MKHTFSVMRRMAAAGLLCCAFSQAAHGARATARAPLPLSALSTAASGTTRLQFSKTGGPQDRIRGDNVWTSSGLGIGVPPQAAAVTIKNISKYQIVLGMEEKSKDGADYAVTRKVTLASNESTSAFAGETWATRWVIYGPIGPNPTEGRPQIEITWRTK